MTTLINPAPALNIKYDSANNVLANINAQAINPNINNPYALTILSHQTGLSAAVSTALAPVNIGTAISITKTGIVNISLKGHVSADQGLIDIALTRGTATYYYAPSYANNNTSTALNNSLFSDSHGSGNINSLTSNPLFLFFYITNAGLFSIKESFSFNVINADLIQFRASNNTAATTTYIDDMLVVMQ